MQPIGANTWIWTSPLDDDGLSILAPRIASWGFDVVELPLENVGDLDAGRTAELLGRLGLGATVCVAMSPERSLVSEDTATVQATQVYLRGCIDLAGRLGAEVVGGPIYAPVGAAWRMSGEERSACLVRLVEGLRPVVDYAGERGVRIAIEPLNRFETSVVNTVGQVLDVLSVLNSPACGVLLDTFHMNIEEKAMVGAVIEAGSQIVHVQACGNDRGTPGADHLDWPAFASALRDVGYGGAFCIESFTPDNHSIARAASIWRPLASSQDAIAVEGLAFLRRLLGREG